MKILVCGTNYGSSYVRAIGKDADHQLIGILSRGSQRSLELARHSCVPHYTSSDELPDKEIDVACVAVPNQAGVELTLTLLRRGISVITEHPMDPFSLEKVLDEAAKQNVCFHLNSHFGDIDTAATFVARCVLMRERHSPLFINALLNLRTLYSCLDIVGRALGGIRPYSLHRLDLQDQETAETDSQTARPLFTVLQGELGGIPATVQCLNYASREDDASAAQVSHQIMIGFPEGNLLLGEASGPILWFAAGLSTTIWTQPAWTNISSALPPTTEVFQMQRDNANRLAVQRIVSQIETGVVPSMQTREYLLDVSRAWQAAVTTLGPVQIIGDHATGS